jgi:hypothetical protein
LRERAKSVAELEPRPLYGRSVSSRSIFEAGKVSSVLADALSLM